MALAPHVLVVEDDDDVRRLLGHYLSYNGYEVTEAANGRAALDALRARVPDLVLTDLRMPEVDGLQVLAAVRAEHDDLPVVVMSGAGLLGDAVAALKLGAVDYILKPFADLTIVKLAVDKALERVMLLRENRRYRDRLEASNRELSASLQVLREDEEAGRQIQLRLLPERERRFGPLTVSYDLTPSAHLSGDFVDCFAMPGGRLGFYLADVAGHGVSSALVTVFLKSFVQRQLAAPAANEDALSPAELLSRLNEAMLADRVGKHVAMFLGVVDHARGELAYATAGQFPAPILSDDGQGPRFLAGKGLPVGLFPFASYVNERVPLSERFVFVACSDGVLDLLGGERLDDKCARLLAAIGSSTIDLAAVRRSLGIEDMKASSDDVTLLMVRRGQR